MDNKLVVERIFELQRAIRGKNNATAFALQRAIVPLLEYPKPLAELQRNALMALKGVGQKSVDLILRVIGGEAVDTIAANVPVVVKEPQRSPTSRSAPELGNWDGSWDNSVRAIEGD